MRHFCVAPSFLPFNQGRDNGAGNPPSALSYSTAYLWEQTWHKDSILNLIQNFITQYEEEDDKGKKTGKKKLIFPRYHQLDTVNRLITHAKDHRTVYRVKILPLLLMKPILLKQEKIVGN